MSAYIVEDFAIHALVDIACSRLQRGSPATFFLPTEADFHGEDFTELFERANIDFKGAGYGLFVAEDNRTALGRALLLANYLSIQALYGDEIDFGRISSYKAPAHVLEHIPGDPRKIAQAFQSINNFDYQTCEAKEYRRTWAGLFTARLREHLGGLFGYETAWGAPKAYEAAYGPKANA